MLSFLNTTSYKPFSIMSTPKQHLRNAENQIASTLASKVARFVKAKKNRSELASQIRDWANDLYRTVKKLEDEDEVHLPSPIPPLAASAARSIPSQRPVKTILTDLCQRSTEEQMKYLEDCTDKELYSVLSDQQVTMSLSIRTMIEDELHRKE